MSIVSSIGKRRLAALLGALVMLSLSLTGIPDVHGQTDLATTSTSVLCIPFIQPTYFCGGWVTDTSAAPTVPTGVVSFSASAPGFPNGFSCTLNPSSSTGDYAYSRCAVRYAPSLIGAAITVTAFYSGDPTHLSSEDSTTIFFNGGVLQPVPTTISVNCTPPFIVHQSTLCSATVQGTAPTGTFTFVSESQTSASGLAPNTFDTGWWTTSSTCSLSSTSASTSGCSVNYWPGPGSAGNTLVGGAYSGDLTNQPSRSLSASLTVTKRITSTSVSCSVAFLTDHHATPCTATVTDTSSGTPMTPTQLVVWSSTGHGTFSPSSCTLVGVGSTASCTVTYTAAPGKPVSQTITATYVGDTDHSGSSGSTRITTA